MMKRCVWACGLAAMFSLFAISATAADSNSWQIDPNHSAVTFVIRHLGISNIEGTFKASGTAVLDDSDMTKSTVNATIDITTVNTRVPARDKDLQSPNYFDAAMYPTATFASTKITKVSDTMLKMTGNLTMHGVTKEVNFDLTMPTGVVKANRTLRRGAEAKTTINRSEFNMNGGLADHTLADSVALTIDVEMIQPDPNAPPPAAPNAPAAPAGLGATAH